MSKNSIIKDSFLHNTISRHTRYVLVFITVFTLSITTSLASNVTSFAANTTSLAANTTSRSSTISKECTYYRYRISLRDKKPTHFSLESPESFLSAQSIARRNRFQLPVDSTDLPVCQEYKEQLIALGFPIVLQSKWQNTVVVALTDTLKLDMLRRLPFVLKFRKVFSTVDSSGKGSHSDEGTNSNQDTNFDEANNSVDESSLYRRQTLIKIAQPDKAGYYGYAHEQTKMTKRDTLNVLGYTGRGVSVAVIDAGFQNVDTLPAFEQLHVVGTRNFNRTSMSALKKAALPDDKVYDKSEHGTKVLSCLASYLPNKMVGVAYDASYYLLRSEEESTESLYEMDTYAAALEYADSVGVQLINSSLGYFSFDDSGDDIRLRDLDGQATFISREASMVASKGILLVCSAGNSGDDAWKKITPPADAQDVLVVGAVRKDSLLADFSSIGCTADGRIVPTIVTQGEELSVMSSNGWVIHADGTSFAAPQIAAALACLMQAYPNISPKEWIEWIKLCSDRVDFPNNIYGYGIPDFEKLCILLQRQ